MNKRLLSALFAFMVMFSSMTFDVKASGIETTAQVDSDIEINEENIIIDSDENGELAGASENNSDDTEAFSIYSDKAEYEQVDDAVAPSDNNDSTTGNDVDQISEAGATEENGLTEENSVAEENNLTEDNSTADETAPTEENNENNDVKDAESVDGTTRNTNEDEINNSENSNAEKSNIDDKKEENNKEENNIEDGIEEDKNIEENNLNDTGKKDDNQKADIQDKKTEDKIADDEDNKEIAEETGKEAGKDLKEDAGKEAGKDLKEDAGKEAGKDLKEDAGKEAEKDLKEDTDKETDKEVKKDTGKETSKDSKKGNIKKSDKEAKETSSQEAEEQLSEETEFSQDYEDGDYKISLFAEKGVIPTGTNVNVSLFTEIDGKSNSEVLSETLKSSMDVSDSEQLAKSEEVSIQTSLEILIAEGFVVEFDNSELDGIVSVKVTLSQEMAEIVDKKLSESENAKLAIYLVDENNALAEIESSYSEGVISFDMQAAEKVSFILGLADWEKTEVVEEIIDEKESVEKNEPFEYKKKMGGYIISLSAEPSVLPDNVETSIRIITETDEGADIEELVKNEMDEEKEILRMITFDITFTVDGEVVEPEEGTVNVSIQLDRAMEKAVEAAEETYEETYLEVYHIDENEGAQVVECELTEDNNVVFDAEKFSPYTVVLAADRVEQKTTASAKKKYKVHYDANGGNGDAIADTECIIGEAAVSAKNTYKRKGYKFVKWNTQADGKGDSYNAGAELYNLTEKSGETVTLYAIWKKVKYTITYNLNGGSNSADNPESYYVNTKTFSFAAPSRKGYTFAGWYSDSEFTNSISGINKGSTGNKTVYAKWTANKYTVVFDGNGATSGSMADMKGCKYNKTYTLTANAYKKNGYKFSGWNTKADGSGKSFANKAEIKNLSAKNGATVKLYAMWKMAKYTITYELAGGTNNSKNPSEYTIETETIKLQKPSRKGYNFAGWYTDSKYSKKVTELKKGSKGNKTFYAKWTANKYTVSFAGNGAKTGSLDSLSNCKYGKTYTLPISTFTRSGYKFTGWNTKADGSGKQYADGAKIKNLSAKNGATVTLYACWEKASFKNNYGVFLSVDKIIDKMADYKIVVIDAQYLSASDIARLKNQGHIVYSYINVGSLENFRSYYSKYSGLALGKYEHWDEEVWIDVSSKNWQNFILKTLAPSLMDKGIDGFFVDNCDVYYNYPKSGILNGLSIIMKGLKGTGKKVMINGGDCFLDAYCSKKGKWSDVITGINQESVYSKILWDENKFSRADKDSKEYSCDYLERYGSKGAEIYLLEYTTDASLIKEIKSYCKQHGFKYYISGSLQLN
ncbi:InlB B-repeat-containing protein [Butyrivibrio sp. YAB3001]|uniref:InlB B-repeat-containing protein n=1 Tax=Butyrivibrio sp. YAB3001 TaxID=1520812 RepID=UPI0008F64EAA|nr:InlB B-repeat-containing protein [Butyrivibrio sp. YAB3001]SFB84057.1 Listeria/Bacterioides repeat-containing protein [Butyrivibrio sp. YAB3001]